MFIEVRVLNRSGLLNSLSGRPTLQQSNRSFYSNKILGKYLKTFYFQSKKIIKVKGNSVGFGIGSP